MKRTTFAALLTLGALAIVPVVSRAQPCPPSSLTVVGGTTALTPCPTAGTTFSTTFSQNENPISEGGVWAHASNGWQKIQTTGGNAIAAAYTEVFDDAYAYLGNWSGNDYEVTATVLYSGLNAGEAEILLRVTDSSAGVSAYEVLYNVAGSWQLVRWNGPLGDYRVIHPGGGVPGSAANGAQIRARIVGNRISLFWRESAGDSWSTLLSDFQDPGGAGNPLPTGKPGLGIYVHAGSNNRTTVGFQDYSVSPL